MDIFDLKKQPHLSASGINDYVECSLLYKLGRVDKNEPEFVSDSLLFGSAIHIVLAQFYQELIAGIKLQLSEVLGLWDEAWHDRAYEIPDIKYSKGKDFDLLRIDGKKMLSIYYQNLPEIDFTILAVEEPFSFTLDTVPVSIIGVYDLVIEDSAGVVTIIDHKTAGRAYGNDEIEKNFQMSVYHLAARKNGYGDREILLRFDCLLKTKNPRFEQYYTSRSETDEIRTEKKITQVWEGINKEVYIPNETSWKCGYCAHKKACNNWFLEKAA
ncbi:RecB family exonuclease [candidate division KSB1 bacterium]